MKARKLIQIALLLFVAVSVVYLVSQESRKSLAASPQATSQPAKNAAVRQPKVVVYYFHGNFRCVSCRKLEAVSQQAVMDGFPKELKQGALEWQVVNVESSGNEHFVADYKLFSKSLVVVRFRNGQQAGYKNLMKAWELLQDDEALRKYVQSEVKASLQES
jgi:hypothetical protein